MIKEREYEVRAVRTYMACDKCGSYMEMTKDYEETSRKSHSLFHKRKRGYKYTCVKCGYECDNDYFFPKTRMKIMD